MASKQSIRIKDAKFSIDGVKIFVSSFSFDIDENETTMSLIGATLTTKQGDETRTWTADNPLSQEDFSKAIALMTKNNTFQITLSIPIKGGGLRNIALNGCRLPRKGMNFPADGVATQTLSGTFEEDQYS